MTSPLLTMPARKTAGVSASTPGIARISSPQLRDAGMEADSERLLAAMEVTWISPVTAATPSRTAWRKPAEMATARIITRKLTAIETAASFPWNLSFPAMNREGSIYQMWTRSSSGRNIGSPSVMPKASKKVWKFLRDTFTRFSAREWTSMLVSRAFSWSVMFWAQMAP